MSKQPLDRWVVTGTITTLSPMRIGTGGVEPDPKNSEQDLLSMAVDHAGNPIITATSLKGAIRARLVARATGVEQLEQIKRLLGEDARPVILADKTTGDAPRGGRAEFADCVCVATSAVNGPEGLARQTAIDRKTRTALDGALRQARVVNRGTKFNVEIIVDRCSQDDVCLLLAGLALLDGDYGSNLGGGRGVGRGLVLWEEGHVDHYSPARIVDWMTSELKPTTWREIRTEPCTPIKVASIAPRDDAEGVIDTWVAFTFDGPMLIGTGEPEEADKNADKTTKRLKPLRDPVTGQHAIPGSSLRGAVRAQAERIFSTVHDGPVTGPQQDEIETPIDWLFGKTGWTGAFQPRGEPRRYDQARDEAVQEFLAIDRFTGGGADGAKFSLNPAIDPVFVWKVRIRLEPKRMGPAAAALGLLALVFRDIQEGDLTVGYGANKGYGRVRVLGAVIEQASWPAIKSLLAERPDNPLSEPKTWTPTEPAFQTVARAAVTAFRSYQFTGRDNHAGQ